MEIKFKTGENADVVTVSGSIDALTAADLTNFILSKIDAGYTCLVLDLSSVEFMSSAGLHPLLAMVKESRRKGCDLRLAAVQSGTEYVLNISGVEKVVKIYADVEAALESFAV